MTPGSSNASAIQRPSSSRSSSMDRTISAIIARDLVVQEKTSLNFRASGNLVRRPQDAQHQLSGIQRDLANRGGESLEEGDQFVGRRVHWAFILIVVIRN